MIKIFLLFLALALNGNLLYAQTMRYDKTAEGFLVFHPILTDADGKIIPWNNPKPQVAYDSIINKLWNFWDTMRIDKNGLPYYMNHQVWLPGNNDGRGLGGDQMAQALSSWQLLYQYTGNERVKDNMRFIADYYITHSLSAPNAVWPNIPYPYNTYVYSGFYDGDMILGKGFTQPDKAGSFGIELVKMYMLTGDEKYIDNAVDIANTLARLTKVGNDKNSPIPFKVNAATGKIGELKNYEGEVLGTTCYSTNWAGTLQLFQMLTALKKGNPTLYKISFDKLLNWMKKYPLATNKWGPFFEDVPGWSDTQINAITFARYMMENHFLFPDWKQQVAKIFDWVYEKLGNDSWKKYGVTVVNEQTSYPVPGQSHTSRQAAAELLYAQLSGDTSRNENAVLQLNWATYMVNEAGISNYPRDEVWFSDGYVDYIRHYLRAMTSLPTLAPANANHILSSTSIISKADYAPNFNKGNVLDMPFEETAQLKIFYKIFDKNAIETIRMMDKPIQILQGNEVLPEKENLQNDGWNWKPLDTGGVLTIKHSSSNQIKIK
ncbi:MAG: hypothetical protein H7320_12185 [Ferruginibacter sp.]|nr:hypothetical protein [Ferruginibacter sp.]